MLLKKVLHGMSGIHAVGFQCLTWVNFREERANRVESLSLAHSLDITANSLAITAHFLAITAHSLAITAHSLVTTAHYLAIKAHYLAIKAHSLTITAMWIRTLTSRFCSVFYLSTQRSIVQSTLLRFGRNGYF